MAENWSVDPDRVAGILRAVDDQGALMETAYAKMRKVIPDGESVLVVDGRQHIIAGWNEFWRTNEDVPGKIMYAIASASEGITAASIAVITGDETMTSATARQAAQTDWEIPSSTDARLAWSKAGIAQP